MLYIFLQYNNLSRDTYWDSEEEKKKDELGFLFITQFNKYFTFKE